MAHSSLGASAPRAAARALSPSLQSLTLAAVDAASQAADRFKGYDALALLLHEQHNPRQFDSLSPDALAQLMLTLNAGMREAIDILGEACDAIHQHADSLEA